MQTDIVIGANFGDEGKGLITDFYAAKSGSNALVVRHNSSAQAGHSVTLKDGRRHVFGHIGAGSFAGAATYLSRHFICHPLLFAKEHKNLSNLCSVPDIYVDRRCRVTTPYDMIINQMVEVHRGSKRHGSCGVGFGETIERNLHPEYALTIADILDLQKFLRKLMLIRHEWLPKRLLAHGITTIPTEWAERIEADTLLEDFLDATIYMMRRVIQTEGLPETRFQRLVFEGAQGLMLDQDHAYFPHVTRSSTGIKNAFEVLGEAGVDQARVTYVTRSYLTRHGAGPLPNELFAKPYPGIVDPTNITNAYQGHLRFAWLDLDSLAETIAQDRAQKPPGMQAEFGLAVTCLDQIDGLAGFIERNELRFCSIEQFLERIHAAVPSQFGLASYGPHRGDIREWDIYKGTVEESYKKAVAVLY